MSLVGLFVSDTKLLSALFYEGANLSTDAPIVLFSDFVKEFLAVVIYADKHARSVFEIELLRCNYAFVK